jgi:hypothetical protein
LGCTNFAGIRLLLRIAVKYQSWMRLREINTILEAVLKYLTKDYSLMGYIPRMYKDLHEQEIYPSNK